MKKIILISIWIIILFFGFIIFSSAVANDEESGIVWLERQKLIASDGLDGDYFGVSVSIDGDYAIVGSFKDDNIENDTGSAYIYKHVGDSWVEDVKLTAQDGTEHDLFGASVSINGDYALIGAYEDDISGNRSGSAYVFKHSGESWVQQAKLIPSDEANTDNFGVAVSIYGDYALVGGFNDEQYKTAPGLAYVFKRNGETWVEEAKLNASDGKKDDWFGYSVSINGDYATVGAIGIGKGAVYVFKRNGTNWIEQQKLTPSDGETASFGESVAIDGNYIAVGGLKSVYIFKLIDELWTQQTKLIPFGGESSSSYGSSVSIKDDVVIIGDQQDDANNINSGSAYIFRRDGDMWTEEAKLTPSDAENKDFFGRSVSTDGENTIIGAWFDDDNGDESGSAYIFEKNIQYFSGTDDGNGIPGFELVFVILAIAIVLFLRKKK